MESVLRRSFSPQLSVLLCSYNREEKLERCLSALKSQTLAASDYEVVCVNDGSENPATREIMLDALKTLTGVYLEHQCNLSLAAARNTAMRAALGEFLVFINDDTYPEPRFLEEHLGAHRAAKRDLAILGFIPFEGKIGSRLFSRVLMERDLYFPFMEMKEGVAYHFGYFITGNLSLPRKCFLENDIWFDETFIRYGYEDVECGYRLWQKGLRVFYNPRAIGWHDHLVTFGDYRRRAFDNGINILQVVAKHPELMPSLIGTSEITDDIISRWEEFVARTSDRVELWSRQIEEVEANELKGDCDDAETIISDVADAVKVIREYDQTRCFLEALRDRKELKERLLSRKGTHRDSRTAP